MDLFNLVGSTGAADTAANSVYGSGVLNGLNNAIGTAANVLTAIQAAKNGSQVQANGVPVAATPAAAAAPSGFLAKLGLPAGFGVPILAGVAILLLVGGWLVLRK